MSFKSSLNIITPINTLSYGNVGRNLCLELSKHMKLHIFPMGNVEQQALSREVKEGIENSKLFDVNADCLRIWHQFDMSMFVGKGKRIGFPIFELDTFTDIEKHHLNSLDLLIVCTQWAKTVCENNGIRTPIKIVNLGVDRNIFNVKELHNKTTTFFNIGKWELRKGHDVLIQAFQKAFTANDDVTLFMCCHNPFLTTNDASPWVNLYKHPKIKILPRLTSQEEVAKMINVSHCGLFLSRAEGWNLGLLEAMSCGRHVITTNYSGHTEFCNTHNSMLIEPSGFTKAYDGKWFFGHGKWMDFTSSDIDTIANYMKDIHALNKSGKLLLNEEGIKTASQFTWQNAAKQLLGAINED